ncbi:hypothetical protein STXM2123_1838 [Streptomyces sp. F-3]|uniref:Integral membrane protein n=1 Tax=Streptomyces thermogriseus TaxID=75292 RepID=A0ABP4DIE7_9ACTN|nr:MULTISPECIES: hypothetical protein [Streptomyces]MDN5383554.1 hypothetical protein [Streptomyces sp. LB8]GAT81137.1 hypothetical protein STXM2123_1838 [Streptomyces sp. F-3]
MDLWIAAPLVLLALLNAALGVAAVARGWLLPSFRSRVHQVRLHGWGHLMAAGGLFCHAVPGLLESGSGIRSLSALSGSGLLLGGVIAMGISRRER